MILKKVLTTIILFFLTFLSFAQTPIEKNKNSVKKILFVCEHGAARSTIAAAHFNKIAKEQGLNYIAVFKGANPDTELTPDTKKGLTKDNFDIKGWSPELVSDQDIAGAYKIITFDCKLPTKDNSNVQVEQWNGVPPISKDYDLARNEIVEKVNKLITELLKGQGK